ncbi:MAG: RagB/SusD family nutrient uptake outer membrane protein, partial [Spirosoma sp.]|nr:RagB/SusD family nutrient uptake outer membrane protein [Spirosoma sp.]
AYKLSTSTGTKLIDEILFYRRIELWGEGHRFLDLKRLNLPLNRNGANHNPAAAVLFDVPAGDKQWEFLIPRREMNANKAIVQNPL